MDLKNNKLFIVLIVATLLNAFFFFGSKFIIEKTANKVIEKLQKDYSPSPYGPGIDPDKINPNNVRRQLEIELLKKQDNQADKSVWRHVWEQDRGFNLEQ